MIDDYQSLHSARTPPSSYPLFLNRKWVGMIQLQTDELLHGPLSENLKIKEEELRILENFVVNQKGQ